MQAFAALLVLLASANAGGDAEPSSEVTLTEIGWMAREVAPVVEEVAGRKLIELPEIVLASPEQIAEAMYQEQLALLLDAGAPDRAEAEASARRASIELSGGFNGKYGFLDKRLYVSVDGIRRSMLLEGGPDWMLRPMIRLVLAHELAHALLDQHVDLAAQVHHAPNGDAIMALNCAVEGHAVWVHEQVGERLGLHEAVALTRQVLGADEPIRRRMRPDAFTAAYVYGLGRDFVAHHAEVGGAQRVWRVMADPPDATSMIVAPDSWDLPVGEVDPVLRRAMRRASARLAGKDWRADGVVMGDYQVRDQLVRAGADDAIADELDVGWNSRLVGAAAAGVELQLLRFKTPAAARAFVDDMRLQSELQSRQIHDDPFFRADTGAFDLVRGDRSGREAITVTLIGEDRLGRVWVARGTDVVQVVLTNAPATDRELAASIHQVFRSARR